MFGLGANWGGGPLSGAIVNNGKCSCGKPEEHCIVDDEGNKTRLCNECYEEYLRRIMNE